MTSYVTPKKNAAFITYVSLEDQANAGLFKTSPTLAAGDFKVSIDGGALANLATLPTNTPSGSAMVKISLSADEMNGDNITVVCTDAAGAEWYDLVLNIQTSERQVDDLAYPATSGRSLAVDASGNAAANVTYWAGQATSHTDGTPDTNLKWINGVQLASTSSEGYLPAEIDAFSEVAIRTAIGLATANMDTQLAAVAKTGADGDTLETLSDQIDAAALEATAQAILEDTGTTLPALIGGLSGATVKVVSSVDGGTVTVYAADTWRFTVFSDQLALADYETLGLIVKQDARQTDNQALLYVRSDTGLARIDGAAPSSAANGALTAGVGSFSAVVHVAETAGVGPGSYTWWLKGIDTTPTPDEAVTLATGRFVVLAAGLQAVV